MTTEPEELPPPVRFACDFTARAFLIMSVLVLNGSGSILSFAIEPRVGEWLRILSLTSFAVALVVSVLGLVGVLIDGVSGCGEITIRGRKLRRKMVGLTFLGVFTLPWVLLVAFSWLPR